MVSSEGTGKDLVLFIIPLRGMGREVGRMAKGKYEQWLEAEGLLQLESWARDGLSDEDIAKKMGISRSTLNEWKKKYPDISDTLKKGKDVVDAAVENALLKRALSGDTTAQIFWLKNRKPDKWRDKQIVEAEVGVRKLEDLI